MLLSDDCTSEVDELLIDFKELTTDPDNSISELLELESGGNTGYGSWLEEDSRLDKNKLLDDDIEVSLLPEEDLTL